MNQKITAQGPARMLSCFCMVHELRKASTFLKDFKENQSRVCDRKYVPQRLVGKVIICCLRCGGGNIYFWNTGEKCIQIMTQKSMLVIMLCYTEVNIKGFWGKKNLCISYYSYFSIKCLIKRNNDSSYFQIYQRMVTSVFF